MKQCKIKGQHNEQKYHYWHFVLQFKASSNSETSVLAANSLYYNVPLTQHGKHNLLTYTLFFLPENLQGCFYLILNCYVIVWIDPVQTNWPAHIYSIMPYWMKRQIVFDNANQGFGYFVIICTFLSKGTPHPQELNYLLCNCFFFWYRDHCWYCVIQPSVCIREVDLYLHIRP